MNDCIQTTFDQYCKEHDLPTGLAPIDILRGSDLTEEEKSMNMTKEKRLACQCQIKGDVKIKF